MKIIGHTATGYLAEIAPDEVRRLTGNYDDSSYSNRHFGVGHILNVSATWDHLSSLLRNGEERKKIADSLRAAATLIEHTPSPIKTEEPATATTIPGVEAP